MGKINYKKWLKGHKRSVWHILLSNTDWTYQGKIFYISKEKGFRLSYPQIEYSLEQFVSNGWVEQDTLGNLKKIGEITMERNPNILKNRHLKNDSLLFRITRDNIGIYKIVSFYYHDIVDTEEKEKFFESPYFNWLIENRKSLIPEYVQKQDSHLRNSKYWPTINLLMKISPKLLMETFLRRRYPQGFEFSKPERNVIIFPYLISFLDDIVKNPEFLYKLDFNEITVELKFKIDTDMKLDSDTLESKLTISRANI